MTLTGKQGGDSNERSDLNRGRMIDVGGHRLYIRTSGTGTPAVLMEPGLGASTSAYGWLEQGIASFTTYCVYDRAGLGRSEESGQAREASAMVQQLHGLLGKAGVPGPYVLMGHSMGGLLIRLYASCYPEEVVGLVFLDSSHPEQFKRLPRMESLLRNIFSWVTRFPWLARPLLKASIVNPARGLPPEYAAELAAEVKADKHIKAMHAEVQAWAAINAQVRAIDSSSPGDIPVAVFSASLPRGSSVTTMHQLHRELAALSSQSTYQVVEGSTHITLVTKREYAQRIVETIRAMVEDIRAEKTMRNG
jgi:pimeloyl-ACP methyl ester carboxylesterase